MKTLIFFLLLFPCLIFSQSIEFNLKGITSLNVKLNDQNDCLSSVVYQNVVTESKLKLKTAGLKLDQEGLDFVISIYKVTTNNISIWIRIEAEIELKRQNEKIKTNVLSYSNLEFHNIGLLGDYNRDLPKLIDNQLNKFIDQYLQQNE